MIFLRFPESKPNSKTSLILTLPKTDSSIRKIYLQEAVAVALKEHKEKQDSWKDLCKNAYTDFNMVIAQDNGRPLERRFVEKAMRKFIAENDLPEVVFHSTRHTSVQLKLKASHGDIKSVQGDTGHASTRMVEVQ